MKEKVSYKIENLEFSGPLDLLLTLIEKNKFNIFDIPIFELTRQYTEYVRQMEEKDLDMISDFLLMSATLLDIKTRMLLPREKDENGEEEDPREELVQRLLEYRRFKYLAGELSDAEQYAVRYMYKDSTLPEEVEQYKAPLDIDELFKGITAEKLRQLFSEVMGRKEYRVDGQRAEFGVIRRERVSLGRRIRNLVRFARSKRNFTFREMLESGCSKTDIVVSFLAVLELMKMGKLEAEQGEEPGDIKLKVTEGIDSEELDLENLVDE